MTQNSDSQSVVERLRYLRRRETALKAQKKWRKKQSGDSV